MAVALAEVCIRSGVGASVSERSWRGLLAEGPHRFLVVAPAGALPDLSGLPTRKLGTMGGTRIDFGRHGSLALEHARRVWQEALPRRLR
jgi:hypothetical protein